MEIKKNVKAEARLNSTAEATTTSIARDAEKERDARARDAKKENGR